MPGVADLETRLLDAVRDAAADLTNTVSAGVCPAGRVYRRDVLSVVPGRDELPIVVVARTPGRSYERVKSLGWVTWTFHVTCLLAASAGGQVKGTEDWRYAWGPELIEGLDSADLIAEAINVNPDALAQIDLTAFTMAGIFAPTVSVNVLCRTPYPPE